MDKKQPKKESSGDLLAKPIKCPVIAKLFGITERRIQQLAKEDIIPKAERGKYELAGCVKGYIEYLQRIATDGDKSLVLSKEKARLVNAQADAQELKNAITQGRVAPVSDLLTALMEIFSIVATQLDGISGRLANELAGVSDARIIRQRLLDESRRIRTAATDQIKRLAAHWRGDVKSSPDPRAAAKKKRGGVGTGKQSVAKRKRGAGTNATRKNAVGHTDK